MGIESRSVFEIVNVITWADINNKEQINITTLNLLVATLFHRIAVKKEYSKKV